MVKQTRAVLNPQIEAEMVAKFGPEVKGRIDTKTLTKEEIAFRNLKAVRAWSLGFWKTAEVPMWVQTMTDDQVVAFCFDRRTEQSAVDQINNHFRLINGRPGRFDRKNAKRSWHDPAPVAPAALAPALAPKSSLLIVPASYGESRGIVKLADIKEIQVPADVPAQILSLGAGIDSLAA